MTATPALRRTWLVGVLVLVLAGDAVRYTIGWVAYGVVVTAVVAVSVVILVRGRHAWRFGQLPYPLVAFLALTAVSTAWSFYPAWTALGATTTIATAAVALAISISYSWRDLLDGLGLALRALLALSLVFEFTVAAILRRPILPLVAQPGIDYGSLPDPVPPMLYWSRGELFEVFGGGRIQGVVGNAVLLGFLALVALIVFAIQWSERTVRTGWSVFWLLVAAAVLLMTRSATITLALAACAVIAGIVLLLRRQRTGRAKAWVAGGIVLVLATALTLALTFSTQLLSALGKSEDLTGRIGIWEKVIALAQQRPAAGWGWVSYWVPGVPPFDDLAFRNGVRQLHAHNAWLDVWFQLGVIGLVVFGALVVSTLVRAWLIALDRSHPELGSGARYTTLSMLPLLLLVALLVQSLAESRLLVEGGMLLLALLAVKTKTRDHVETEA